MESPPQTPNPPSPAPPTRVLVVDDNEDIITLTRRILERQNYEVLVSRDGKSALELARQERPDLILLDVMLPEIDGLEVCRQLKGDPRTRQLMILLVTGRGSIDHRVEGLEAGADDYITKPFHLTELLARVRSALRIKRLTDELEERNRQLIASERDRFRSEKMATIGLLASGIAHEFNNIMSGISGYAQLAKKNPQYKDQLVEVTLTQAERALQITRSLSSFNRTSVHLALTEITRPVENALCLVKKEAADREVEILRDFQPAPAVLANAGQLQQVFLNLLINALQAIQQKGKVAIRIRPACGEVRVEVSDTGCGIAPEIMDKIFDPFFTTKGALGGGNDSGSGLGLTVSYNIVRSHGGNLTVGNNPEGGATFTVHLPASTEAVAPASAAAPESSARLPVLPSRKTPPAHPTAGLEVRLLIADPDEAVREMVEGFLRGSRVQGCDSWRELFSHLGREPFDLLILDTELPGEEPFLDQFEKLRRSRPDLPLLLTTGNRSSDNLKRSIGRAQGHLLKPYSMENLANLLLRNQRGQPSEAALGDAKDEIAVLQS
ncbi:MAG: response regulator [Planctomycetes bacterium]|nr:response regulator [Planctomycetota bacterium]